MTDVTLNLEKLKAETVPPQRPLFTHQSQALADLNQVFSFKDSDTKGGLLVMPTGAGKTFTTVKWLGDYVLPKQAKVLWLAHTYHLLDQAYDTLRQYARWIPQRRTLNVRTVSGHPAHYRAGDIQPTDDVVVMTTQTAIRNLAVDAVDSRGQAVTTNFRKFIDRSRDSRLVIVLDEAHHAPAYGCRTLLLNLRQLMPDLYLLGLTATPTYKDETRRGWLKKLFEQEIITQAKQPDLVARDILAVPHFIEMPTGREFEVDDQLYHRLVREHKDLPEDLIDRLANDAARNDYIVREYVQNRQKYGKTIIFADRWFQCVYLKEKLQQAGVTADAVYSRIDADPGSAEARNQRTATDNHRILQQFKYGTGQDALDVLINVRILTEGTDVPSVKTVFITRQTTSSILMTQMIGRALRGKRAGGGENKSQANIVLFVDEWKQLINWATPALDGGTETTSPVVRGYYPLEYISIRLVEELSRQINLGTNIQSAPFSQFVPLGWYQVELVVNTSENDVDEIQSFTEFVMVYEHTKPKFEQFMTAITGKLADDWAKEHLPDELDKVRQTELKDWLKTYFDPAQDDIGHTLEPDMIRLVRHIAQRGIKPRFYPFSERDKYDLDDLAGTVLANRWDDFDTDDYLRDQFSRPGNLWKVFYKTYDQFKTAFNGAKERRLYEIRMGRAPRPRQSESAATRPQRELADIEKRQVKQRDGNRCLACGAKGRGVRLEIDHIRPVKLGGPTTIENSQTLCSVCNREKRINEINFRTTATQLGSPKELQLLMPNSNREDSSRTLTRMINFFYHCRAVAEVRAHQRSNGRYYHTWEIQLFAGNDPAWLKIHRQKLLNFIKFELGHEHVRNIKIL